MNEYNKKLDRKVNVAVMYEAEKRGITIQKLKEDSAYIKWLTDKIEKEMVKDPKYSKMKESVVAKVEYTTKPEPVFEVVRKKPKADKGYKRKSRPKNKVSIEREKEINLVKDLMFKENLGYREIASRLGKDEKKIKETVVKIMCDSVA